MRSLLEPSFVLHRRPYRESSLLLELFSREQGRLGAVARGARRSRRGRAGLLQPFRPLFASWSGRGELVMLGEAEPAGIPPTLPPRSLPHAFYLNELLLRLLPRNDPHPKVFDAYACALGGLDADPEPALRRFELSLLDDLGYGPDLLRESGSGQAVEADRRYRFELERGPVAMGGGEPDSPWLVHGTTLLALQEGRFATLRDRREARRLMQALLRHYLGERPIRSRELVPGGTRKP